MEHVAATGAEKGNVMKDPYYIEGPAVISFSGGRTSAFMLRKILDAGTLRDNPDAIVLFANTGKERPETLDFVHEVETRWDVPVRWVEYERFSLPKYKSQERAECAAEARAWAFREYEPTGLKERGFRIVDFWTASRDGEPFENLIDMVALPNLTMRLCTQELKIRPMRKLMQELGYDFWWNVVGIRSDEPKRVTKMRGESLPHWDNVLPLAEAKVVKADVLAFWAAQPFDLNLPLDENGDTYGGNCDLCFLKSTAKRLKIAKENPEWLEWWIEQERRTNMTFRPHGVRYIDLLDVSEKEACSVDDDFGDCVCHE